MELSTMYDDALAKEPKAFCVKPFTKRDNVKEEKILQEIRSSSLSQKSWIDIADIMNIAPAGVEAWKKEAAK
ncbi:MAG: hypothetical protein MMC33_006734 [Icmadophila ericetorum]|nr:hypothetical protein [Icmadophila ericetorum]